MNNQELTQEKTKIDYIREMAEDDFECGHPFDPDDFDEFKKGVEEDIDIKVTHEDFELYFAFFDEVREQAYDLEQYDDEFDLADDN